MTDELHLGFSNDSLLSTSQDYKLSLVPSESRALHFQCESGGPNLCSECGIHGVTEAFITSTFKGEPEKKCIGRKCHWCGWRGPCLANH